MQNVVFDICAVSTTYSCRIFSAPPAWVKSISSDDTGKFHCSEAKKWAKINQNVYTYIRIRNSFNELGKDWDEKRNIACRDGTFDSPAINIANNRLTTVLFQYFILLCAHKFWLFRLWFHWKTSIWIVRSCRIQKKSFRFHYNCHLTINVGRN